MRWNWSWNLYLLILRFPEFQITDVCVGELVFWTLCGFIYLLLTLFWTQLCVPIVIIVIHIIPPELVKIVVARRSRFCYGLVFGFYTFFCEKINFCLTSFIVDSLGYSLVSGSVDIFEKAVLFQKILASVYSSYFFRFRLWFFMNEHIGFDSREKWISILNSFLVICFFKILFNSRLPFKYIKFFVSHRNSLPFQ